MNDEQLIEISSSVDSYMSTLLIKYDMTPLTLSAILLARAMLLNKQSGSVEDFLKLASSVSQNPPQHYEAKVH